MIVRFHKTNKELDNETRSTKTNKSKERLENVGLRYKQTFQENVIVELGFKIHAKKNITQILIEIRRFTCHIQNNFLVT